jgi:membrane-bound lytic murein transglycosylase D
MTDVARLGRAIGALVAVNLVLVGCAAKGRLTTTSVEPSGYSGMVSAREYGFVRPAVDVVVKERRTAGRSDPSGDIWERVRSGMRLDLNADSRIDASLARFSRDPQYLSRLAEQGRPYIHMIVDELERRGMPMELAFLPHVESRFSPTATSPKAAAGIWQFMPYTGREMGLRQDVWYDERRDPLASTGAALDYLQQLNRRFDGDWALAMAAYNCGPGCIANAQAANRRQGRPTDFWSLNLPNETKQYVPQILATARLVAEPNRYGMVLPVVPNRPQLEVVKTTQPLDLNQVASATGVHLSVLQRLNQQLKLGRTAPTGPGHVLVPAGTGQRMDAKLTKVQVVPATAAVARATLADRDRTAASVRTSDPARFHLVKGSERLESIARTYSVDPQALAEANGMAVGDPLLSGQTLRVPSGTEVALIRHLVSEGDSIDGLARRYGVAVKDLKRWNNLADTRLSPGDLILVYPPGREPTS